MTVVLDQFIIAKTKASLLAHVKGIPEDLMRWRRDLLEAVVTKDELELIVGNADITDDDAIHDNVAGEINAISAATAADADIVIIEDADDSWNKKKVVLKGIDTSAFHDDVAAEFTALSGDACVVDDVFVYEDNTDSWNKKKCTGTDICYMVDGYGIDHGGLAGLDDDDHPQYLLRSDWLENGFVDVSDTALAWDDGTRTLTLSPAVDDFDYFYDGVKYTEDGNLSATIDAPPGNEGTWVFYIGSGGAASLSAIQNPSYEQVEQAILDEVIVAYVYWDETNTDGRLMDERHGYVLGRGAHHYLHELFGAQYSSGLTLGDITTDQNGSSDAHAQFSCTAGKFYDEDLEHETLARASTDTWECYYVNGSGDVRWVNCEATFPVYAIGGVIAYNNAGTLTAVTSNKYCLYHVFATNIKTDAGADYYPVVTPGTSQYNTKAEAQDAALTEIQGIDMGEWPQEEVIPIATVIYHHGAAMTNGVEAAIQSTEGGDDFIDWRFTAVSGSSTSVNDHGVLSGLSDDDHTQYLLADGTRSLSAAWDAGSWKITAETFESDVAAGTAPLTVASNTLVTNLNADLLDGNEASAIDYSFVSGNDGGTDVSAAELEELTDGSVTTLHDHDVTGLNNWPTIDYSYVSGNDGATDVSGAELETLTDGSDADSLHTHSADGIDTSAIHDDTAGEIDAIAEVDPENLDLILIEDQSDSWNKKSSQVQDLPFVPEFAGAPTTGNFPLIAQEVAAPNRYLLEDSGYTALDFLETDGTGAMDNNAPIKYLDSTATSRPVVNLNGNDDVTIGDPDGDTDKLYLYGSEGVYCSDDVQIGAGTTYVTIDGKSGDISQTGTSANIYTPNNIETDDEIYCPLYETNFSKSMSNNVSQNFFKWGTSGSNGEACGYTVHFTIRITYDKSGTTYYWVRSGKIEGQIAKMGSTAYGGSTSGVVWKSAAICYNAAGGTDSPSMSETVAQGASAATSLGPYFYVNLTGFGYTYTSGVCEYCVISTDANHSGYTLFV